MPQTFYMKSIHGGMQRSIKENVMTQYRYKKPLLAIVAALPISSALAASATPASARDVGPVIAGGRLAGSRQVRSSEVPWAMAAIIPPIPVATTMEATTLVTNIMPRSTRGAAIWSTARSMTSGVILSATGAFASVTEKSGGFREWLRRYQALGRGPPRANWVARVTPATSLRRLRS